MQFAENLFFAAFVSNVYILADKIREWTSGIEINKGAKMTTNESKLIRQTLKGFVDSGLISDATMQEIASIKEQDGNESKDELITRKEAMEKLKVSQQSLINYEKRGRLQKHKIAGLHLVRYRLKDIEELCI